MQRSKVINRRPLSQSKDTASGDASTYYKISRKGNMLSITGYEANGW